MENIKDELEKIVAIVVSMEFNEAAYRRKYFNIKSPMKQLFTPAATEQAVATLFQNYGLKTITRGGYQAVIDQILMENSCKPKPGASVLREPDLKQHQKTSFLSFPVQKPRNKKRKTPELEDPLCRNESREVEKPSQELGVMMKRLDDEILQPDEVDDEYVDITNVEDMEIDMEEGFDELSIESDGDVHEFSLVADVVWGDLNAEEVRELVLGLSLEELEVVPDGSPLVKEARRVGNQVFLLFNSMLLAELVLDAFSAEWRMIRGNKVTFRRCYSRELEFLARSFSMQTSILTRLVYVSGLRKDSYANEIDQFQAMLMDVRGDNPSSIKSMLVLPGKREIILELFTDIQADLFMYRSGENRNLKHLLVLRSKFFMPRVIRCPVDDDAQRLAADAEKVDHPSPVEQRPDSTSLMEKSNNPQPVPPSQPEQPQQHLPVSEDLELSDKVVKRARPKHKMEVRLNNPQRLKNPDKELAELDLKKKQPDDNKSKLPELLQPKPEIHSPKKLLPKPDVHSPKKLPEERPKVHLDDPKTKPTGFWERMLFVKRLKPGYNVDKVRAFFPTAVAVERHDCYVRLEFESEAAADAVMSSYVERPGEFFSDEYSLLIFRSASYVRPGQLNKRERRRPANEKPCLVVVTGIPSILPENVVRGALAELLDRELAVEPLVTEYGANLIRDLQRRGELFVLSFYTQAAARVLVSLKKPLWFAGKKISFSLEDDGDDKRRRIRSRSPGCPRREKSDVPSRPSFPKRFKQELAQRRLVIFSPASEEMDFLSVRRFFQSLLPDEEDDLCVVERVNNLLATVVLASEAAADSIMDLYVSNPHCFRLGASGLCIYRDRYYVRDMSVIREFGSLEEKPEEVLVRGFPPLLHSNILSGVLCELLSRAFFRSGSRITRQGVDLVKNFSAPISGVLLVTLCSRDAVEEAVALGKPLKLAGEFLQLSWPERRGGDEARGSCDPRDGSQELDEHHCWRIDQWESDSRKSRRGYRSPREYEELGRWGSGRDGHQSSSRRVEYRGRSPAETPGRWGNRLSKERTPLMEDSPWRSDRHGEFLEPRRKVELLFPDYNSGSYITNFS